MSHREKSQTPWIKSGSVANDGTVRDEFKTVLPPKVYDDAVAQGCDMSWFIRQEPMTDRTAETVRGLRLLLGDDVRPVSELLRGPPKRRPRLFKKHRDSVSCHDCMPGLGGRCTCCVDKE